MRCISRLRSSKDLCKLESLSCRIIAHTSSGGLHLLIVALLVRVSAQRLSGKAFCDPRVARAAQRFERSAHATIARCVFKGRHHRDSLRASARVKREAKSWRKDHLEVNASARTSPRYAALTSCNVADASRPNTAYGLSAAIAALATAT